MLPGHLLHSSKRGKGIQHVKCMSVISFVYDVRYFGFGDISLGCKFLTKFKAQYEHMHDLAINWIVVINDINIEQNLNGCEFFFNTAKNLGVNVILAQKTCAEKSEISLNNVIYRMARSTDLFFIPAHDGLTSDDYKAMQHIPFIKIEVADQASTTNCDFYYGLGENTLGIPIDEPSPNIAMQDKALFDILLGAGIIPHNQDDQFCSIPEPILCAYAEKNTLYFGYINLQEELVVHNRVNSVLFINTCIALSNLKTNGAKGKKHVDIVIPCHNSQNVLSQLDVKLINENFFRLQFFDSKLCCTEMALNENTELPILRIFSPFPIAQASFSKLLAISSPFVMATGAGSMYESIVQGKFIVYQVMAWHSKFYQAYKGICRKVILDERLNALDAWHNLLDQQALNKADVDYHRLLAVFIFENETELIGAAKLVRDEIAGKHNLYINLMPIIMEKILASATDRSRNAWWQAINSAGQTSLMLAIQNGQTFRDILEKSNTLILNCDDNEYNIFDYLVKRLEEIDINDLLHLCEIFETEANNQNKTSMIRQLSGKALENRIIIYRHIAERSIVDPKLKQRFMATHIFTEVDPKLPLMQRLIWQHAIYDLGRSTQNEDSMKQLSDLLDQHVVDGVFTLFNEIWEYASKQQDQKLLAFLRQNCPNAMFIHDIQQRTPDNALSALYLLAQNEDVAAAHNGTGVSSGSSVSTTTTLTLGL